MHSVYRQGKVPLMQAAHTLLSEYPTETVPTGTVLLRRLVTNPTVIFVDSGRVALGVVASDGGDAVVEHQLGIVDGPCWLEAAAAVLTLPSAVDAIAQTAVQLRRIPLGAFQACVQDSPLGVQSMLLDIAKAHRQQTALTVSRFAKDAEARCAEWLLGQSETNGSGGCAVHLQQRKRAIAAQLGIAPETLSRVLRHLRELRLITGSGRVVDLVDLAGLRTLAGLSSPRRRAA